MPLKTLELPKGVEETGSNCFLFRTVKNALLSMEGNFGLNIPEKIKQYYLIIKYSNTISFSLLFNSCKSLRILITGRLIKVY